MWFLEVMIDKAMRITITALEKKAVYVPVQVAFSVFLGPIYI